MAYAQVPQFVSLHGPKIGCNELPMVTVTEVLQSDPVKRLFSRQNVYLQNPVASCSRTSDENSRERSNGAISDLIAKKKPELSVIPIMNLRESAREENESIEDKHLLPSKYEGKSGVALVPIKRERRRCGHYEPCESLVCDVSFQQFAAAAAATDDDDDYDDDDDEVRPMIAVNIDDSEIDAPVTKHCKNDKCDALSIDHDRCRRAIIRCHRCDLTKTCDICLVVMKTRKNQVNHRNCKMRIEYRHNRTTRGKILRDRMREREVQILEDARSNRTDYTDPLTGHDRAMESLHNNSELIIIPKASLPIQQHPTIRITSVTGAAITPNTKSVEMFVPRFSAVSVKPVATTLGKKRVAVETPDNPSPAKQAKEIITAIGSPNLTIKNAQSGNSFVTVTRVAPREFIKPVDINNLLSSSTEKLTPMTVVPAANPFLMPVRLVQTQGIPKFCLVPDTATQSTPIYVKSTSDTAVARPVVVASVQQQPVAIKPAPTLCSREPRRIESKPEQITKGFKPMMRRGRRKKVGGSKKVSKSFECTFCFKRFSTDWYFKLHIAKHKGEIKFTCKFCKKPFMHLYNMTKHVVTMHKKEAADESYEDVAENADENEDELHCRSCDSRFENVAEIAKHPCCIQCLRCDAPIYDGNLMIHLKVKHGMSDEKAVEEYERQKRQGGSAAKNRVKTKRLSNDGIDERIIIKAEPDVDELKNRLVTKKRHLIMAENMSRLKRRKLNSQTGEMETVLTNETEDVDEENTLVRSTDVSEFNQGSLGLTTMLSSSEVAATTNVVLR